MRYTGAYKLLPLLIISLAVCLSKAEAQRRISAEPQQQGTAQDSSTARQGRLKPREGLGCDINDTTSFTGRVLLYSRARGRIALRMRTDEATTEQFTITFPKASDPARVFLFKGEQFKPSDWKKIERRTGSLRPGMRATVWACYVGGEPKAKIIDWQPRETDTGSVY